MASDNFDREPGFWTMQNPLFMAGVVILCSAAVAVAFFYCVLPCARFVNGALPEDWALASRKVHPTGAKPKLRREVANGSCREALKRVLGYDDPPHPASRLNHRPVTALEELQRASGTSEGRLGSAAVRSDAKGDTASGDRLALMSFFAATGTTEKDWVNASGGGRQGWLDDDLAVGQWQGVAVDQASHGRVVKLFLPKNHVAGPLSALQPLSHLRKLALWENCLTGTLQAMAGMPLLKELDLSKNQLTGTLEPLAGCFELQDLNVGENRLEGPLHVVGNLRGLTRLLLHRNNFDGALDGLAPCTKLDSLDVSNNPLLWGPLPPHHHQRWTSGAMPCNAAGTNVGADQSGQKLPPLTPSSAVTPDGRARFARGAAGVGLRPGPETGQQLLADGSAAVRRATPGQPLSRSERATKQQEQIAAMMARQQEQIRALQARAAAAQAEDSQDGDGKLDRGEIAASRATAKPAKIKTSGPPSRPPPPRPPSSLIGLVEASSENLPLSPKNGPRLLSPVQGASAPRPVSPISARSPLAYRAPTAMRAKPALGKR